MTLLKHVRHNLVAYIALFFGLGGTSFAAVAVTLPANSVGTAQIQAGAVTASKISPGVIPSSGVSFHFGSWNADGSAAIYEPDVAMLKRGTGLYTARFFTDVSGCTRYASLAGTTPGQILVTPSPLAADLMRTHGGIQGTISLDIRTFDTAGNPSDRPFSAAAICSAGGVANPPGGVIGAVPAGGGGGAG